MKATIIKDIAVLIRDRIYLIIAKYQSQIFCDYKIFIVITINQNSIIEELYLNNKTNIDCLILTLNYNDRMKLNFEINISKILISIIIFLEKEKKNITEFFNSPCET